MHQLISITWYNGFMVNARITALLMSRESFLGFAYGRGG